LASNDLGTCPEALRETLFFFPVPAAVSLGGTVEERKGKREAPKGVFLHVFSHEVAVR